MAEKIRVSEWQETGLYTVVAGIEISSKEKIFDIDSGGCIDCLFYFVFFVNLWVRHYNKKGEKRETDREREREETDVLVGGDWTGLFLPAIIFMKKFIHLLPSSFVPAQSFDPPYQPLSFSKFPRQGFHVYRNNLSR